MVNGKWIVVDHSPVTTHHSLFTIYPFLLVLVYVYVFSVDHVVIGRR